MYGIIAIILICVIIAGVTHLAYQHFNYIKMIRRKISFKESMDLSELPVITMYQGEKKFNFLLDTGSNDSILSKPASRKLKGQYAECIRLIEGLGSTESDKCCVATLEYKDLKFDAEFLVSDGVTATFASIKKSTGVQIHGILGTKFLQKYSYILDFNELVAYSVK